MILKARVLVVDDERLIRICLRMVLAEDGYEVDTANSVAVASNMLDRYPYQILITDLELPDGKGFEIIRYARNLDSSMESILLTTSDDLDVENEALMAGAMAIVRKPCDSSSVVFATGEASIRAGSRYQPRYGMKLPSRQPPRTA